MSRRNGDGPGDTEEFVRCPRCNGYGVLSQGPYGEEPECRYCHGGGEVPADYDGEDDSP